MTFDFKSNWILIKSGDLSAFKELYFNICQSLIRYSKQIVTDQQLAEEVVHDVFLNIWNSKSQIDITGSIQAYLYQSVHNYSINKLRQKKISKNSMQVLVSQDAWLMFEETYQINDFTIEKLEAKETEEKILKILEGLPEQCKEIFILSRFQNWSNIEIASKLNLSVSTIKTQIYRAVDKIRIDFFK